MAAVRYPAELSNLTSIRDFVLTRSHKAGLDDEVLLRVELILEELAVNIFSHAYTGKKGNIEVECRIEKGLTKEKMFCMIVRDWSDPFNPLEGKTQKLGEDLDHRSFGGVGLHIIRTMADFSCYSRTNGYNEVVNCFLLTS